jgi:hypothetical protein
MEINNKSFASTLETAPENAFVTVCGEEEALWRADGAPGKICLCLKTYAPKVCEAIRSQAEALRIRIDFEEWYDYDAYANLGGSQNESRNYRAIKKPEILVKDGAFFGAVLHFPDLYEPLHYAAADSRGKPVKIYTEIESRPYDNIEEPDLCYVYYLVKAEDA